MNSTFSRLRQMFAPTPARMRMWRTIRKHGTILAGAFALLVAIGGLTLVLFVRSSTALERQLRETLRATAVTAAFSIDGDTLDVIRGPEDMGRIEYLEISSLLRNIINEVPQIRFAYVLRRTDDPAFLEFVVDADALSSPQALDRNGNGQVDSDEEPSFPGERYDVSDTPALQDQAFRMATTDEEVTVDQWGELLSGYAPVRSPTTGEVVGVLGIDMDAAEFRAHTRSVLSPFAVMLILMLTCLLAAGVALLVESRQLRIFARMASERSGLLRLTFHQLGEPITILQWGIETLGDAKDDPAELQKILPENLNDMREGVRRLGSIIDTLQEAEKVELNAFENRPVEQSVRGILDDIVRLAAPSATDGAPRVQVEATDATLVFDSHLLAIVLRRLIENAIEYSAPATTVRVVAKQEGKWLRIDVIDSGCGIPAQDLTHLFVKYSRASNARTMKPDGNGLGLYIAKGIVELMGGVIRLSSVEGAGTTVTIRIPHHPLPPA